MKIYTVGFTKKSAKVFFEDLLAPSGARRVLDIRARPSSQLSGFAKVSKSGGDFQFLLSRLCDMDYVHVPELAPSDRLLSEYRADELSWDAYSEQYIEGLGEQRVEDDLDQGIFDGGVLLCSEASPEHCHRRLAAEYLQRHWDDVEIIHL
ncbi:MAG: DUF488 domain-containing protein [Chloroflexi bacterium]|nr:DUF488 domain-containing protein [Chloroflexota bacterium]